MNKPNHLSKVSEWQKYLKQFMTPKKAKEIAATVKRNTLARYIKNVEVQPQKTPLEKLKARFPKFSKKNESLARLANTAAQNSNRRLQNWTNPKARTIPITKGSYDSLNCGRYKGKFNRIIWNYEPQYTSYYRIAANKKAIIYVFGFAGDLKRLIVRAPKGMFFGRDDNGLVLRRQSDGMDYHPTTEDLQSKKFAALVRSKMAENFKKRLAAKKLEKQNILYEKIFQQDIKNTMVTLNDSRKAGNCIEGSLSFAERRLNIPREEILKGGFIFKINAKRLIQTGDERAIKAVRVAWNRETTVCI